MKMFNLSYWIWRETGRTRLANRRRTEFFVLKPTHSSESFLGYTYYYYKYAHTYNTFYTEWFFYRTTLIISKSKGFILTKNYVKKITFKNFNIFWNNECWLIKELLSIICYIILSQMSKILNPESWRLFLSPSHKAQTHTICRDPATPVRRTKI